MIGVQCALVILDPYPLGIQLEGIAGKFQGLSGVLVSGGMSIVTSWSVGIHFTTYAICYDAFPDGLDPSFMSGALA
jgi:hypothetical protein